MWILSVSVSLILAILLCNIRKYTCERVENKHRQNLELPPKEIKVTNEAEPVGRTSKTKNSGEESNKNISMSEFIKNLDYGQTKKIIDSLDPVLVHDSLASPELQLQEMYEGKRFSRAVDGSQQQHYGTFAANYGPLGTMLEQPNQWTLSKLVNKPGYGDSWEGFHNYSAPWQSGPHPMWPVPPVPAGTEALYGFQPTFYDPHNPPPQARPDMTSEDVDSHGFPITSTQYNNPAAVAMSPQMDFRPEMKPDPYQMMLIHEGFPMSHVLDPWLNTQGATPFTGRPSQWATKPYPYGNPGEQVSVHAERNFIFYPGIEFMIFFYLLQRLKGLQ